jgi:enterochelin esterase-like enzyme
MILANVFRTGSRQAAPALYLLLLLLWPTGCFSEQSADSPNAPPLATPTTPVLPGVVAVINTPETTVVVPPSQEPVPAPEAASGCEGAGEVVTGTFTSVVAGREQPYRLYLPPCYGEHDRRWPTLWLLHGNTRGAEEWEELGVVESADFLITTGQIAPLIIVMPDGRPLSDTTSGGPWSYEAVIMQELIPWIEQAWCADPRPQQRAIGGISRGGYWALQIAFRHPQAFVSAGGHSAALLDISPDPTINPVWTGVSADLGTLRLWFDYGANDGYQHTTRHLHDHFSATGFSHIWQIHPTGGHTDDYWRSRLPDYLIWYNAGYAADAEPLPCR